jgi:riboflavin synthase
MFTGIIEAVGEVVEIESKDDLATIEIEAAPVVEGVKLGDSIAVNGACLTVCNIDATRVSFQAVRETLECTNLGDLQAGSSVNLERAMRADGRLDGHIVQGHVDGVGRLQDLRRQGDDVQLLVDCDAEFADLLVDKGSVAINGVSLTVVTVQRAGFDVVLIPHTLSQTMLDQLRPGDRLNLEADVLGKYVKRYLGRILGQEGVGSAVLNGARE